MVLNVDSVAANQFLPKIQALLPLFLTFINHEVVCYYSFIMPFSLDNLGREEYIEPLETHKEETVA
jgi:hypothetical protein